MDIKLNDYEIIQSEDQNIECQSRLSDENSVTSNATLPEYISISPEDVRWFYRSVNKSKRNDFHAFSDYDSLRLETKYLELASFKGDNYSKESQNEKVIVRDNLFEVDVAKRHCSPIYWSDVDDECDVFRGTWFLSSNFEPLNEKLANTIESQHVMHFGSISDVLLTSFNKNRRKKEEILSCKCDDSLIKWYGPDEVYLYETKTIKFVIRFSSWRIGDGGQKITRGYKHKANFYKRPEEITHLCFVVHGIGQRMGFRVHKSCTILKQSCKKIIKEHLKSWKKLRVKDHLEERYENMKLRSRIEFIPIEWRSHLNLDGGTVDKITPHNYRGLRTILNSTLMDILYYSSSMYRPEITQCVESEINRLYSMFCARNPYFEPRGGKVSIVAHSLGSVICYDVIRSWVHSSPWQHPNADVDCNDPTATITKTNNENSNDQNNNYPINNNPAMEENVQEKVKELTNLRKRIDNLEDEILNLLFKQSNDQQNNNTKGSLNGYKKPDFPVNNKYESLWKRIRKVDYFFTIGSPLPAYLALRGVKPSTLIKHPQILPKSVCNQFFNVYFPSDPIAYRVEPLVCNEYHKVPPVDVVSEIKRIENQFIPSEDEDKQTDNYDDDTESNITDSSSGNRTPIDVASSIHTYSDFSVKFSQENDIANYPSDPNVQRTPRNKKSVTYEFIEPKDSEDEDSNTTIFIEPIKEKQKRKSIIAAVDELHEKLEELRSVPYLQRIPKFIQLLRGPPDHHHFEYHNHSSDSLSSSTRSRKPNPTLPSPCSSINNPHDESTSSSCPLTDHRYDYVIGGSDSSSLFSLFTSHNSYWTDLNLARFIVHKLIMEP